MAVATAKRTDDFVMVKADRENQQAPVLHVRLSDGSLALAEMADVQRVCMAAVQGQTGSIERKDEYVARCVLVTDKGAHITGTYFYPAKYLKAMSLVERAAMRSEMELQAQRVAYRTLGVEADEHLVVARLITWSEPL